MDSRDKVQHIGVIVDENDIESGALKVVKLLRPEWKEDSIRFKEQIRPVLEYCFNVWSAVPRHTLKLLDHAQEEQFWNTSDRLAICPVLYFDELSSIVPSPLTMLRLFTRDLLSAVQSPVEIASSDGITNKLVGCKPEEVDEEETILVRVYGNKTDLLIDRKAETRNIILLNRAGLAPNLYATFENGLAYRFIPGNTLNCESVTFPSIYPLVAKTMACLHKITTNGETRPEPLIWDKLRQFLDLVPEVFSDEQVHKRYLNSVTHKAKIVQEAALLKIALEKLSSPVVFAHNDLLLGNVIYTESKNTVTFIDYEYAGFNYQAYDIGNHFVEFAGLGEPDYSKYPTKEFQINWLKTYLTAFNGMEPSNREIEKLYVEVNQFALLAHIFWGVWSLIQAEHSYIEFDYISYAAARFNEYFDKKEEFLSLECPS